jgi:hypothetical protein
MRAFTTAVFVSAVAMVLLTTAVDAKKKKDLELTRAIEKCDGCKSIVKKFYEQYKATDTIQFRGESKGWSLDNEKFLGRYKMGEARLVEILEHVCGKSDPKCNAQLPDLEDHIEAWWAKRNETSPKFRRLEEHLCIKKAKLCCAPGKYGKKCSDCPGKAANSTAVCNEHGECNGYGVRAGTGKCKCTDGRGGKSCAGCKKGHFAQNSADSNEIKCVKCNEACATCDGPEVEDCDTCAKGFTLSHEDGECVDFDECDRSKLTSGSAPACGAPGTWCKNTRGSFTCAACDSACAVPGNYEPWCSGGEAKDCVACNKGYMIAESGGCEDVNECAGDEVTCEPGKFCDNTPGSFGCTDCDRSCLPGKGCTGPTNDDCVECNDGYDNDGRRSGPCFDTDECKLHQCGANEDCTNSAGTYDCECRAPNLVNDGGHCTTPEGIGDLQILTEQQIGMQEFSYNELNMANAPDITKLKGSVHIGESKNNLKLIEVSFDEAEMAGVAGVPRVLFVKGKDVCCGDTFGFAAKKVTQKGFTLVTWRNDTQTGWGQEFSAEWGAHARLGAKPASNAEEQGGQAEGHTEL